MGGQQGVKPRYTFLNSPCMFYLCSINFGYNLGKPETSLYITT